MTGGTILGDECQPRSVTKNQEIAVEVQLACFKSNNLFTIVFDTRLVVFST